MSSYTARRLETATPEHLDITTRRTFLGPIPAGWLRSHRKQWYEDYFSFSFSRRPSFRAGDSGFDGTADSHESFRTEATSATQPTPVDPRPEPNEPSRADSESHQPTTTSVTSSTSLLHSQHSNRPSQDVPNQSQPPTTSRLSAEPTTTPRVRFTEASRLQLRARARRLASKTGLKSSDIKDGALLKVEKMLVRIDITQQHLPEYDEKISQGVETRTLDKWREYMVVCRKHVDGDAEAVLQLYRTRVIAATSDWKAKTRPKEQLALSQNRVRVNLFSSLDKTLCIWTTKNARTTIYYLKPELSASSVEWYTFLRTAMGMERPRTLQIDVPDLRISLRLTDPFRNEEIEQDLHHASQGDDGAMVKAMRREAGAARAIVKRCTAMLNDSPGWKDVLKLWSEQGHIGLAWKRYDRLEWVHGSVEQRMYGSLAMSQTHDLELRAMDHYPTKLKHSTEEIVEPRAVEGFLIRLTSQSGGSRRLGKFLFKRLYFTTQDHFLVFLRPSRAIPPPPPQKGSSDSTPTAQQLAKESPLLYDVDPYSADRFDAHWWRSESHPRSVRSCDRYAEVEADRQVSMLLASDGFVDLCDVKEIRAAKPERNDASDDPDVDVNFDMDVPDRPTADGETDELDEDRIFELVMTNGLVVRLQAFSKAMRAQWIKRLRDLVEYWSQRTREDMLVFKSVRQQNLKTLGIDERAEAFVGQFAYKWEGVSKAFASPTLYNVCGISSCRAIHLAGMLYRKPRRHTTFSRCHVVLCNGHMLIYEDAIRKRTGQSLNSVHHERTASIDLQGCYLYSGLLTEDDLLYQNQTFDSNAPGHHTLPRIYLENTWTSSDEDTMTTFVIWHGTTKSWFRSSKTIDDAKNSQQTADGPTQSKIQTRLKRVGKLGATGRSVVFMARSRAERDRWVLAIQNEIERLRPSIDDDIRLMNE